MTPFILLIVYVQVRSHVNLMLVHCFDQVQPWVDGIIIDCTFKQWLTYESLVAHFFVHLHVHMYAGFQ